MWRLKHEFNGLNEYFPLISDHDLLIAKEQFQNPVPYPYDLIKSFVFISYELSHVEHCPIFCLLQYGPPGGGCHFYFTLEGQSKNCFIGYLSSSRSSRTQLLMNITGDVNLVPKIGIDVGEQLAAGMGRGRSFGSCSGSGFHNVNNSSWTLDFNLRYSNSMNCWIVIYNYPLKAKLRMTVDNFNVSHYLLHI